MASAHSIFVLSANGLSSVSLPPVVTGRAHRLYVLVMLGRIAEVVVVLMAALAALPHVPAVGAGQVVRAWDQALLD